MGARRVLGDDRLGALDDVRALGEGRRLGGLALLKCSGTFLLLRLFCGSTIRLRL